MPKRLLSNWMTIGLSLALVGMVWFLLTSDQELQQFHQWEVATRLTIGQESLPALAGMADKMEALKALRVEFKGRETHKVAVWKAAIQHLCAIGKTAPNLETLELYHDDLSPILSWRGFFVAFRNLRILRMEGITLQRITTELYVMEDLEELYLIRCDVGVFNEVVPLKKLRILDLSRNHLDELWTTLAHFPALQELYLDHNQFYDIRPITYYKHLRKVSLSWNFIGDGEHSFTPFYSPIKNKGLEELHLQGNRLYHLPAVLSHLPNLQHLDLSHNYLQEDLKALNTLSSLRTLDLTNNNFSNASAVLSQLPQLQEVIQ